MSSAEPLAKDERMAGTHRVDAVRAHLLECANERDAAIASYLAAAEKTSSLPERNYLLLRAARLRGV
jgi:predicted RNA polymerase sigma factor